MDVPEKISYAAERLRGGHRVNRITVRDFLGHFGAQRRGAAIVEAIDKVLDSLDLTTEPDFRSAWIDEPICLLLKGDPHTPTDLCNGTDSTGLPDSDDSGVILDSSASAVRQAMEQSAAAPVSTEPETSDAGEKIDAMDPTFRIGSLPAANKPLVVVNQNDSVARAITLMLQHDFSQLPVMQSEREVKGVVTWKSIASKQALGGPCQTVGGCREDARIVDANRTLFETIPVIVEYGYVLVRQHDKRVTGVVTASDLSMQFQALSEPFLLLREIELHLRGLVRSRIDLSDVSEVIGTPSLQQRRTQSIADLTFGDYVRLFQNDTIWNKLDLRVDKRTLVDLMDEVRKIRNDVMHFDPDPMTADDLTILKKASRLMQSLFDLLPDRLH